MLVKNNKNEVINSHWLVWASGLDAEKLGQKKYIVTGEDLNYNTFLSILDIFNTFRLFEVYISPY